MVLDHVSMDKLVVPAVELPDSGVFFLLSSFAYYSKSVLEISVLVQVDGSHNVLVSSYEPPPNWQLALPRIRRVDSSKSLSALEVARKVLGEIVDSSSLVCRSYGKQILIASQTAWCTLEQFCFLGLTL